MIKSKNNKGNHSEEPHLIPLKECLAKTRYSKNCKMGGVFVETHCKIVGYIALELIKRMPVWLVNELYPTGSELIAASHDVGKVSPTFQDKIYRDIGKELKLINCNDKTIGHHWTVSQATLSDYCKYIAGIIGRHRFPRASGGVSLF